MFDYAYPQFLYLLLLLPVIWLIWYMSRRSRQAKIRRFGRPEMVDRLMPMASKYKPAVKITLRLLALAMLIVVLARPRTDQKEAEATVNGIEIMIAFDVSNSMLASSTDDPNGTPRLSRAVFTLEKMVDKLKDDKVGLLVFAGEPKLQLPLTTDYYSAKVYLNELNPNMISYQGTDLGGAITMAMNNFSPAEDVHKAIILITDAENHEGDAVEAAKKASEAGIQVDVIGLGSAKGAPIPLEGQNGDYLRDGEGKVVLTTIDEKTGQAIAEAGNGIYVNGANSNATDKIAAQLDKLQKSEFKKVRYKTSAEQFPTFAWLALAFLLIDIFVLNRKIGWFKNVHFFSKK